VYYTRNVPPPRPRVLVVSPWFDPGFKAGGLVRAVANMVGALAGDIDFSVVTSDRDLGDAAPYPGIEPGRWVERDGARVLYLSPGAASFARMGRLVREPWDAIHVNGLFSPLYSTWPIAVARTRPTRLVVHPHGMLGEGALRIKSGKKSAFLRAVRATRLYRAVVWQATTELEAAEIRAAIGDDARIEMALNVPDRPRADPPAGDRDKRPGAARFCFFSRVSPKKGLLEAARFFAASGAGAGVVFDILGPIEDTAYWELCRPALAPLRSRIQIAERGAIAPADVHATLSGYHFMILPTHNENFGYAILDALLAGCPVILSDQTPWRDLEPRGAGWTIPLADHAGFARAIDECIAMESADYARRSRAAYDYALAAASDPSVTAQLRRLLLG
jgi:glycosyltransferase involved in cell wall biosynthesis